MSSYIKLFNNHTQYSTFATSNDFITPNVSACIAENEAHFNPYVPETKVVAKYNVTSTSSPTTLRTNHENNIFKSMEIDGTVLDKLVTEYTFDTTGEHIVKYELYDETKLGNNAPVFFNNNLIECIIPDSVTSIGDNVFLNCFNLTNITIPNSITSIGNFTFASCSSITNIIIPDNVTSIGTNVFSDCHSLISITIPNGVISIGTNAFTRCRSLTNIICNAMASPTISDDTFTDVKPYGTLTVPAGSTGYDVWMRTLGSYNWTKVEQ